MRSHNSPPSGPSVLTDTLPYVHLLRDLASSLAHRPVSRSDIACNGLSPLLTNIVIFGVYLSGKCLYYKGRGFYTLVKKVWFSSLHMHGCRCHSKRFFCTFKILGHFISFEILLILYKLSFWCTHGF